MDIDHIMMEVMQGYSRIDPRDLRDTEAHMSESTFRALYRALATGEPPAKADGLTLFGLRVRINDGLDFGWVRYVTENEQERALRRLVREGTRINVAKFEMPPLPAPPEPTMRALLAKWSKRFWDAWG